MQTAVVLPAERERCVSAPLRWHARGPWTDANGGPPAWLAAPPWPPAGGSERRSAAERAARPRRNDRARSQECSRRDQPRWRLAARAAAAALRSQAKWSHAR